MRNGFTLIELLVVITTIVVLLALLMPAMDKAIYQAELTQCSAKLRVIGVGATQYAMENGNWYPHNPAHARGENWLSTMISKHRPSSQPEDTVPWPPEVTPPDSGQGYAEFRFDMRPLLSPYFPINKTLVDPLMPAPLELEQTQANSVHGNYSLRFGWVWRVDGASNKGAEDGAFKMNQKFTWSYEWESGLSGKYEPRSFSVLAHDYDRVNPAARGSHPDRAGKMWVWQRQDAADNNGTITHSLWIASNNVVVRGMIDMNFVYQDLSVQRFYDVEMRDDRMVRVPKYNRGGSLDMGAMSEVEQIPKQ